MTYFKRTSGQIPVSDGTLNVNLNADMVDGYHASTTSAPNSIPVANADGKIDASWLPDTTSFGQNMEFLAYLDFYDTGILNSNWVLRDSNDLPKYWYINNPNNLTLTISNITNNNSYIENVMYVTFTDSTQYIEITSEVMPMEALNSNYYKLAFFLPSDANVSSIRATLTINHIYYDSNNTPHESTCLTINNFEIYRNASSNSILRYNPNGGTTYFHHHGNSLSYYNYAKIKIKLSNLSQPQTVGIASVKRNSNDFSYRTITGTHSITDYGKLIDNIKIKNIDISQYGRVYIPNLYASRSYDAYTNIPFEAEFSFKNDFNNPNNYVYINYGFNPGFSFSLNLPQTLLPYNTSDSMSVINTALYVHVVLSNYTITGVSTIYLLSPRVYQHDGRLFVNQTFTCNCPCQCTCPCTCLCQCPEVGAGGP
jgi:hypothetical protein